MLKTGNLAKSFATTNVLISGRTYKFYIEARNTVGYSLPSVTFSVLAAQKPDTPRYPDTVFNGLSVTISWPIPFDGASPITGYVIMIQKADTYFATELVDCNGSSPAVVSSASCTIPVGTLTSAPFYIEWGQKIYAKVTAKNIVNFSLESAVGGDAKILTNPSAPVGLQTVAAITTAT